MKIGLGVRLTISHVLLVLLTLSAFVLVTATIVTRRAEAIGSESDRAAARRLAPWFGLVYEQHGEWSDIERVVPIGPPLNSQMPMMPQAPRRMMGARTDRPALQEQQFLLERQPLVLYDADGRFVSAWNAPPDRIDGVRSLDIRDGVPIGDEGDPLGYLFVGTMAFPRENPIRTYLVQVITRALGITALVLLLVSSGIAWLWSRWLVRPLLDLSTAAKRLGSGEYSARVREPGSRTGHELRDLALSFNRMAVEIEEQEGARRRFVADAAHELRTPLALLNARVDLMREGIYPPDEAQWTMMANGITRIQRLVDELQLLARLDAGRLEIVPRPVELSGWLADHLATHEPALHTRALQLVMRTAAEPLSVEIDPDRFAQVIDNLLRNAARHSPHGGTIIVTTKKVSSTAEIEVIDQGPGVPPSERKRIFERFVRLDDARTREEGGSGLGLAITAEIVARHNGEIGIHDGSGARFFIRLPLV